MDSRGIYRGRCSLPDCVCSCYSRGKDGMKCLKCLHPPGKHQNLTNMLPSTNVRSQHGPGVGHGQFHYPSTTPGYSPAVGNTTGHTLTYHSGTSASTQTPSYASAAASPASTTGGYHHQHHTSHPTSPTTRTRPPLIACKADGCTNSQYYEHGVGLFDYCSPSCRDRHLLPAEKKKLQDDIKQFKTRLATNASEKPPRTTDTDRGRHHTSALVVTPSATTSYMYANKYAAHSTSSVPELRYSKPNGVKDTGIVISEELYTSGAVKGYLVTGVKCGTLAYDQLQRGELCLLDVIVKMNNLDAIVHGRPGVFEERLKSERQVVLTMNRDIALPCPKDFLEGANFHDPTHIIVLRNAGPDCGLTVDKFHTVQGVSKNSPARECGLKFHDEIVYCAFATKDSIEDPHLFLSDNDIDRAARHRQSIILAVKRRITIV